jgi:two-component system, chemotaxis family, response regulator Rcp1
MLNGNARLPIRALLIEDEPADARYLVEICKALARPIEFDRVATGDDAILYLERTRHDGARPKPDVVFLDLNLPGKDGREVLADIRRDPSLNGIPVIVLTASAADADVAHASHFHAEAYLRKPAKLAELVQAFGRIGLLNGGTGP